MTKIEQKVNGHVEKYGVETLNLVIRRHELSEEKRLWFGIRFKAEEGHELKEKSTAQMDRLTAEIDAVDVELEQRGISKASRPQIVKDLKKYSPDSWMSGFSEG